MSKRGGKSVILANSYVLFVCEGTAEEVIINKLNAASVFDIKPGNLIDITRIRAAKKIEDGGCAPITGDAKQPSLAISCTASGSSSPRIL